MLGDYLMFHMAVKPCCYSARALTMTDFEHVISCHLTVDEVLGSF